MGFPKLPGHHGTIVPWGLSGGSEFRESPVSRMVVKKVKHVVGKNNRTNKPLDCT